MQPLAMALSGGVRPLRDGYVADFPNAAEGCGSVTVIPEDDDGDELALPVLCQGPQEHGDDVRQPPGL